MSDLGACQGLCSIYFPNGYPSARARVYLLTASNAKRLRMQTTKSQILAHLKRSGGSSVEAVATSLGLARMTIRQHLATLERDALVSSQAVRRATGRPHYVFSLTDGGEEMFPKRYDRLAGPIPEEGSLLDGEEIGGLTPAQKKQLLFDKMVGRVHSQYQAKVAGKPLKERVEAVARILDEEGGFAEWRGGEGGV